MFESTSGLHFKIWQAPNNDNMIRVYVNGYTRPPVTMRAYFYSGMDEVATFEVEGDTGELLISDLLSLARKSLAIKYGLPETGPIPLSEITTVVREAQRATES